MDLAEYKGIYVIANSSKANYVMYLSNCWARLASWLTPSAMKSVQSSLVKT